MTTDPPAGLLTVIVRGDPVGQGAIKGGGTDRDAEGKVIRRRPAYHANGKQLRSWRETVIEATQKAMAEIGLTAPLDGPLHLTAVFRLPRGKTVTRELPTVPPDLDHLIRALGDSLTKAHAIADDARIVSLTITEVYAAEPYDPGVEFTVRPIVGGAA